MCQLKYHCIDHNEKTEKAFSTINDKIIIINPKGCGGGPKEPGGFSIGCHFSQHDAMVTKILDFIHIHPK